APLPLFAATGTVLLVVPGPEFGQREHLLVAAALPYLCIFARSLDGGPTQPAGETIAGILAGVGCAPKPQFPLAFVLLEILGRMRGLRLVRRMTISAALTLLLYVAAVLLFFPAYFTNAIPLGLALYGASDVGWLQLLSDSRAVLLADAVAFMLWWSSRAKLRGRALRITCSSFRSAVRREPAAISICSCHREIAARPTPSRPKGTKITIRNAARRPIRAAPTPRPNRRAPKW